MLRVAVGAYSATSRPRGDELGKGHVIVGKKRDCDAISQRFFQRQDSANELFAFLIARMGFARVDQLQAPGVACNFLESVEVCQNQVRSFVVIQWKSLR